MEPEQLLDCQHSARLYSEMKFNWQNAKQKGHKSSFLFHFSASLRFALSSALNEPYGAFKGISH